MHDEERARKTKKLMQPNSAENVFFYLFSNGRALVIAKIKNKKIEK
jgi:hypothetical protein